MGRSRTSGVAQRTDGTPTHHYLVKLRDLPGFGRVYLAIQRVTEAPAIVQAYTGRQQPLPAGMELLVSTGDNPRNLTVEVRGGADGPLMETLEDASNLLDVALSRPEAVAHLQRVRMARRARSMPPAWRRGAAYGAGAALAAVLAVCLLRREAESPGHSEHALLNSGRLESTEDVPLAEGTATWANVLVGSSTPAPMTVRKRVVLPEKPFKGQDSPPCMRGHHAINGGCWLKLEEKAPDCPEGSAEHKGGCYVPVKGEKPGSVSVERRRP
jgi:hypothetical protein